MDNTNLKINLKGSKIMTDNEMTIIIREQIDKYLDIYDDACRQIPLHHGLEKAYYLELAKESLTMIGDLIEQLPDKNDEIQVHTKKPN